MSDFDEKLIDAVRRRDFLYDKSKRNFKLPELKSAAWREIADETGVSGVECERRWGCLRDRFGKELRRKEAPSGSGAKNVANWNLFDSVVFLKNHVKARGCRNSSNILEESRESFAVDEDSSTADDQYAAEHSEIIPKRQKKMVEAHQHMKEAVGVLKDLVAKRKTSEEPEEDADVHQMMKAVEAKVKKFPKALKRTAACSMLNYCIAMEEYIEGVSQKQPSFYIE